jgi:rSAM/selenodomain-associated transferase 2
VDVSVVIPVLNEAALLGSTIARTWRAGATEILVVDGGSLDGTPAIARAAGARVLVSERPGRGMQQRLGAIEARGEALLFLHADTWLEEHGIEQIRRVFRSSQVHYGAFRQRITARGIAYRALEIGNAARVRGMRVAYGDQGIFVRRATLERIGGYPDLPLMEDVEVSRRLRCHGRPALLPGPLHVSARRWQRVGAVRQTLRNWRLLLRYRLGASPADLARAYDAGFGDAGR